MRESNFAFPTQGRACVCISSQLYDRRALDSTSSLPLFNSLTHLTYLTSTSPRIREILTLDGGLERLVRLLRDFCSGPPPPIPADRFYGLLPPGPMTPLLSVHSGSFDRGAAVRFSLAFQCVVNIGVRGSEAIRGRVVQAGMLDVVSAVLEAWLTTKGFAIGPSATGSGAPREPREVRLARRQELVERRQRDLQSQAMELARALRRQVAATSTTEVPQPRERRPTPSQRDTHYRSPVPTSSGGSSMNSGDEASAEDVEDDVTDTTHRPIAYSASSSFSSSASDITRAPEEMLSGDNSAIVTPLGSTTPTAAVIVNGRERSGTVVARPMWDAPTVRPASRDTDMETDDSERQPVPETARTRAVAVVDDGEMPLDMIVAGMSVGMGIVGGVEEGLVQLDQNDDMAMGAPPGAPGAFGNMNPPAGGATPRPQPDTTPRAALAALAPTETPARPPAPAPTRDPTIVEASAMVQRALDLLSTTRTTGAPHENSPGTPTLTPNSASTLHAIINDGPYRDEDVLLSLQLLAYLSKYPHVRQAFYRPRPSKAQPAIMPSTSSTTVFSAGQMGSLPSDPSLHGLRSKTDFFARNPNLDINNSSKERGATTTPNTSTSTPTPNVFTLVERFTFRPSPSEPNLPRLPHEIQYWAAVIMRNACRKDESRGGIRQCANMTCGKWETFPREFAKCRRCRKAKYCGKECQSRAWAQGHRFWCSAREAEENTAGGEAGATPAGTADGSTPASTTRRDRHQRDRHATSAAGAPTNDAAHGHYQEGRTNQAASTSTTTQMQQSSSVAHLHHPHHHHHHHHQSTSRQPAQTQARPADQLQHPPQMHNTIVRVGGPRVPRATPGGGLMPTVIRPRPADIFPNQTQPQAGPSQTMNNGNAGESGAPGPSNAGDRSPRRVDTTIPSPSGESPGSSMVVDQNDPHRTPVAETAPRTRGGAFFGIFGMGARQAGGGAGVDPGTRPGQTLLRIAGMEGGGVSPQLGDGDVQMG